MDIHFNTDDVLKAGLSIHEYLYLRNLFVSDEAKIPEFGKLVDNFSDESLQDRGFIKYTDEGIFLRHKALELFENKELFYKFLTTFPIKAPSGRYLSPKGDIEGVAVKKIKKSWISTFKGKNNLEVKAIKVLEAELKMRREAGSMEYMHNIETWLNQADYEKYEYLLDEEKEDNNTADFI